MPHYSIPVEKKILCWAEVDHDGTMEDAIKFVKNEIDRDAGWMLDIEEGTQEEYEYLPGGKHYCDEKEVLYWIR